MWVHKAWEWIKFTDNSGCKNPPLGNLLILWRLKWRQKWVWKNALEILILRFDCQKSCSFLALQARAGIKSQLGKRHVFLLLYHFNRKYHSHCLVEGASVVTNDVIHAKNAKKNWIKINNIIQKWKKWKMVAICFKGEMPLDYFYKNKKVPLKLVKRVLSDYELVD